MEAKDVWRDDAYNYTGQTLDYAVKMNGVVVKKGHASAKDFPITIYLNRLAVDYLEVDWHNNVGNIRVRYSGTTAIPIFQEMPDAAAQFTLVRLDGDTEVETLYDVVYVDTSRGELKTYLSEPINGHACTQQVLPYTVYGGWSGDTPEPPGPEPPEPPGPEPPGPPVPDSGYAKEYLTFVAREDGVCSARTANMQRLYYSLDEGETWTQLPSGWVWTTIEYTSGQTIMWKGLPSEFAIREGTCFEAEETYRMSGEFDVRGNLFSVYFEDNFRMANSFPVFAPYALNMFYRTKVVNAINLFLPATEVGGSCYLNMFENCFLLETPPALPATTLETECYMHMFHNCTSLKYTPALPATTLAQDCYYGMFDGCTSLTAPPALPATSLTQGCYNSMFASCESLQSAPELPATSLTVDCYRAMFYGCTSLTTPPDLPATQLAESCYKNMFGNCTELRTPPALPATTLATSCYYVMFGGCTSLNVAPILPAPTLVDDCYGYMFEDCGNISSVQCLATNPTQAKVMLWLKNVSDTGVFIKAAGATWPVGESGIPSGWRIVNA